MSEAPQTRVTMLLNAASQGDRDAAREVLPLVYDELRKLAQRRLAHVPPGQTLQATALVHEAYLRVVGDTDPGWQGRGHFFGAAAQAMRDILVERARRRDRIKHGGGRKRVELSDDAVSIDDPGLDMIALDEALKSLEATDPRKARIVMLRFFTGLSIEEIAELLEVSSRTVEREWRFTRAWLSKELASPGSGAAAESPGAD